MAREILHSKKRKIGILGGTFDPVHLGHLIVAQEAAVQLELERVLFVPAGQPWQKAHRQVTAAADRAAMVKLAIRSNPLFRLSLVDIERPGPSYSADTVVLLKDRLGEGVELYFLCGADSLAELPTWKDPEQLVNSCFVVGCQRPGFLGLDLEALDKIMPGIAEKTIRLNTPLIDISSGDIRMRGATGKPIRYLVPSSVGKYIIKHCLYKSENDFTRALSP